MNKDRKRGAGGGGRKEKRQERGGGGTLRTPSRCVQSCTHVHVGPSTPHRTRKKPRHQDDRWLFLPNATAPAHRRDLANLHGTHCHTDPPRSPTLRVARATAVSPLALAPSKTFLFASQRVWAWATFFHGEPRNKSKINRHSKHFEISV